MFPSSPLKGNTGMRLSVSLLPRAGTGTFAYAVHTTGLQFITQLALDDEERATTLLSASTKFGYS